MAEPLSRVLEEGVLSFDTGCGVDGAGPLPASGIAMMSQKGDRMKHTLPRPVVSLLFGALLPFALIAQQAQDPRRAGATEESFGPTAGNRVSGNHSAARHGVSDGVSSVRSSVSSGHVMLKGTQAASDDWQSYPIGAGETTSIAVDNTNAQIVFAGTRDAGVYKSTDGGQTWQPSRTGLTFFPIRELRMDPRHSNILYAGTDFDGIWKTTDAGNSWSKSSTGLDESLVVFNIVIDSSNTSVLYAGLAGGAGLSIGNVYKSEDGGASWVMKDSGIPRVGGLICKRSVDTHPWPSRVGHRVCGDIIRRLLWFYRWRGHLAGYE